MEPGTEQEVWRSAGVWVTGPLATAPGLRCCYFLRCETRDACVRVCWADVMTGGFLIVWGVGALQNNNINDVLRRYHSIQYLDI